MRCLPADYSPNAIQHYSPQNNATRHEIKNDEKRFHSPRLPAKEKVISGALFGWAEEASMRGALLVLLRNRTKELSSIMESFCRQANAGESWSNQRIIINKF